MRIAGESLDLAWRNLLHLRRSPGLLVSSLVEPITFALLIGVVLGGSLGGNAYREYLVAGLLAQTVAFTASFTTVGLARDLERGMIDRFRILPISRASLLFGRTTSDLSTCVASVAVTTMCGLLLLGWAPRTDPAQVVLGYLLVLLFAFAMSWVGAFVALVAPNVQVASSVGLLWLFPMTFVSSDFVSPESLPGPLTTIADWNPITALANALRELFGNPPPPAFSTPHGWAATHPVPYIVCWSVLLVVVFAALSTWRYRVRASR